MSLNPQPNQSTNITERRRVDSIDLLRGIVMVIMMLDHTRDFVHDAALRFEDPTNLSTTDIFLFFTRWVTHFCAPVFVFLAGTSAYFQFARGKSKAQLSWFLVTRGLWLIVLELTIVKLVITFNPDIRFLGFIQVIWVIGVSMIVLAALIHLPKIAIAAFGLLMIALHNLTDSIRVTSWRGPETPVPGVRAKLWILLHQAFEGFPILAFPSPVVFVLYPLIPWVGVMAAGYVFGTIYQLDAQRRRRCLLITGGAATVLFIIIRAINLYGDPSPWSQQKNFIFTALSFINTSKYPPSLLFLLMTLGPAILFLALFETRPGRGRIQDFFITFGRVPLFFYVLQWFTAHLLSILLHFAFGKPVSWLWRSPINFTGPTPGVGFNLGIVYLSWIIGIVLLYPLCKWFARVKQRRRNWWLSYL